MADALSFVKKITWDKALNFFTISLSYIASSFFKKPVTFGLPATVSIEPSSRCILNCPECPAGNRTLRRKRHDMDLNLYSRILDQIARHTLWLQLYFQGEPFMNPNIFRMIQQAGEKKIYSILSTNGHFLDELFSQKIIESGLDRLIISLDGTDAETYNQYRKNGDYLKVIEGIQNLTHLRQREGSHKPYIILQFLVFRFNEHQIRSINNLGKKLGVDRVKIKSAQIYHPEKKKNLIPSKRKYSRYKEDMSGEINLRKHLKNQCTRLWYTTVIDTDGNVGPCCFDKHIEYPMGNIHNTLFHEIWKSSAYQKFRQRILSNRSAIEMCRNCTQT